MITKLLPAKKRLVAGALSVVVGSTLALTACSTADAQDAMARETAARLLPDTTQGFLSVAVTPSKQQQTELYRLSQKMPAEVRAENGEKTRTKLIDEVMKDSKLTYDADLKPWLGDEASIAFVKPYDSKKEPLVVAMVKTKNEAKTRETMKKKNVDEKSFKFIDNYVVIVDKADIEQRQADKVFADIQNVKDGKSASLKKNAHYQSVLKALHGEHLAIAWIDIPGVIDHYELEKMLTSGAASESNPAANTNADAKKLVQTYREMGAFGMELFATPNSAVVQSVSEFVPASMKTQSDSKWIENLPADTMGAFDMPDIAEMRDSIKDMLTSQGLDKQVPELIAILDKLKGEGLGVVGKLQKDQDPEIALAMGTQDAASMKLELGKLAAKAETQMQGQLKATPVKVDSGEGFEVAVEGQKLKPTIIVFDDKVVISTTKAYAEALAKKADTPLSKTAGYAEAMKDNSKRKNAGLFYIDLVRALDAAKQYDGAAAKLAQDFAKPFEGLSPSTSTTTSTIDKTVEEWKSHLQSAGSQGWIEDNHVFSETRLALK